MAPKFEYQRRTYEDTQERATQRGGSFDSWLKNVPTFKPAQGLNTIRFIPIPRDVAERIGTKHYAMDVFVHYNVGGDKSSYPCLEAMRNQRCPVCEYRRQLEAEKADKDEIKELVARKSVVAYIVDRNDERNSPKVWAMSYTLDKQFSQLSMDVDDKTFLPIEDPDEGYDVSFHREGQQLLTKYSGEKIARKPSYLARSEEEQDRILNYVTENPIDSVIEYYSAADMDAALNGRASDSPSSDRGRDEDRGRDRDAGRGRLRDEADEGRSRDRDEGRGRGRDDRGDDERPSRSARDDDRGREDDRGRDRDDRGRDRDDRRTARTPDGDAYDRETGEIQEEAPRGRGRDVGRSGVPEEEQHAAEEGRGRAAREPAEEPRSRRRPVADEPEDPPPARSAGRGGRVADPPPREDREPEPSGRRRPADPPPSTDQGRGRLSSLRDRRA